MNTKPDDAFTSALEWQLRCELRRGTQVEGRPVWSRGMTLVAVALASGIAGAACLGAAQQVQASRRAEVILAGLTLRESAARKAAEVARTYQTQAEAMVKAGTAPVLESRRAESRAAQAEGAASLAALDLAEARASNRAVNHGLSAPLVGGRDFALERLQVQQRLAERAAADEIENQRLLRVRIEAGLSGVQEVEEAALSGNLAAARLQTVADRMKLRARFLSGELRAAAVEAADLRAKAEAELKLAEAQLAAATQRLSRLKVLRDAGRVAESEVTEAQLRALQLEAEVALAKAEVAALVQP